MAYRKFKADQLFTGHGMAPEDSVLVMAEDGRVEAILPMAEAGDGIERIRGILSPGLVNCHGHLELSHMKGMIPEGTGMVDFLLEVVRGREIVPGVEDGGSLRDRKSAAIAAAEEEMLRGGIVAMGDICNTTDSLEQKKAGNLLYHNFIEVVGFMEQSAADRFENSRKVFAAFVEACGAANSLAPHAPYSVSPRLLDLIARYPGNRLLTIHNQESEAENVFSLTGQGDFPRLYEAMGLDMSFFHGTGKRSLESWLPHFYPGQSLILVHNVATSGEDLRWARDRDTGGKVPGNEKRPDGGEVRGGERLRGGPAWADLFFCLCPNANLYISGQLPDIDLLIRYNCRIVLGTDSLASNHRLSILEEMRTLQNHFPHLPLATLLGWATLNGARALQLDSVLGSFERGKQPGVVVIGDLEEGTGVVPEHGEAVRLGARGSGQGEAGELDHGERSDHGHVGRLGARTTIKRLI